MKKAYVDSRHCVACGSCLGICPRQAIQIKQGIFATVLENQCVGCGLCEKQCPASVIALKEVLCPN